MGGQFAKVALVLAALAALYLPLVVTDCLTFDQRKCTHKKRRQKKKKRRQKDKKAKRKRLKTKLEYIVMPGQIHILATSFPGVNICPKKIRKTVYQNCPKTVF